MSKLVDFLVSIDACSASLRWAKSLGPDITFQEAWDKCQDVDWMLWLLDQMDEGVDQRNIELCDALKVYIADETNWVSPYENRAFWIDRLSSPGYRNTGSIRANSGIVIVIVLNNHNTAEGSTALCNLIRSVWKEAPSPDDFEDHIGYVAEESSFGDDDE